MEVNLSKNRICDIHKTAFDAVKHSVQTLNLGHNCLQKVPVYALERIKELEITAAADSNLLELTISLGKAI